MTLPSFERTCCAFRSQVLKLEFLTGDRDKIYDLANKGFNLYAGENSKVNGGFEHSGLFALIDKTEIFVAGKMILNLFFDGLDKKGGDIQQDINVLLEE
jgi:protein SCO1/2